MKKFEKTIPLEQAHVKFEDGDEGTFEGYASVFGNKDSHGDVVTQGAFAPALEKGSNVGMFFNHASFDLPVGKWLDLHEDEYGLYAKGELTPGMQQSSDLRAAMKHETVGGLSVGFTVNMSDVEESDTGLVFSSIDTLREISLCTWPANERARVSSVKSLDGVETIKDIEDWLRESANLSKSQALGVISRVKATIRSDSESHKHDEEADEVLSMIRNFDIKGGK
ncbi:HK97 family phage prohead protease [Kushneria phosphatilytica]|uniref:HK97 family phage prohead protease n=1 Tax=Kushneria phosphatilytica TaxID=657387 RepID=A0A1S1P0W9_9GAMM|nr:HK97 family phage prohead protease [Kushneria phosphatilytica]OHV12125.1 hypothetical protein BH688_05590 [Kushneria phosphatilytica]QEL11320.1 HK97 family phage prohead protease [Kushneria phosphatilytica]